eukprot:TRINITY_DN53811_c0_g1_i2.p1 TRINITY_DN53811_c0_g1~~TRINITY_DN53811_c0_g1_i2.p1  ORF type:complete len:268 (+),score=53.16 TRINITY_DN53811_c0_g1_i2:258-1061(+)
MSMKLFASIMILIGFQMHFSSVKPYNISTLNDLWQRWSWTSLLVLFSFFIFGSSDVGDQERMLVVVFVFGLFSWILLSTIREYAVILQSHLCKSTASGGTDKLNKRRIDAAVSKFSSSVVKQVLLLESFVYTTFFEDINLKIIAFPPGCSFSLVSSSLQPFPESVRCQFWLTLSILSFAQTDGRNVVTLNQETVTLSQVNDALSGVYPEWFIEHVWAMMVLWENFKNAQVSTRPIELQLLQMETFVQIKTAQSPVKGLRQRTPAAIE